MTTNHTPAPWDVNADFDEDGVLPHVYVLHNARDASRETVRANEALISAAPELLAALERILSLSTIADLRDDPDLHSATKQARAALARANGE